MNKTQLGTLKQDESCQKIQDPRERETERERQRETDRETDRERRNNIGKEKSLRKRNKKIEEETVDAPFESNINIVVKKHLIRNYTS